MKGLRQVNRAVNACHAAGIPVVGLHDCTCPLHDQLVIFMRSGLLCIVWPCDRCPVHPSAAGGCRPPNGLTADATRPQPASPIAVSAGSDN